MPIFDITTKPTSLSLEPGATGSIMVVVSNRMGKPVMARVEGVLTPVAVANWLVPPPPDQAQRRYETAATANLEFKVVVPADAVTQDAHFMAIARDVSAPDDTRVEGQTVAIKIARNGPLPKPGIPWWVWVIVAVVVVGAGVGIWLVVGRDGQAPESVRLGLVGGGGGEPFADSCDEVAEVRVRHSNLIDAIQLICRDSSSTTPMRGGTGGTESTFKLEGDERITAVSGSATIMGPQAPFVFSVQVHTDQPRSSPVYGPTPGQLPFRFEIPPGGRFGGLVGRSSQFVDALGVMIQGPPDSLRKAQWQLGPVGASSGPAFTDKCDDVAEVRVREGHWIDAIQLVCRGAAATPVRGGSGGTERVFKLEPGERITAVSGSAIAPQFPFVFSIQLYTNRKSSPVYGNHGPTQGQLPFRFAIPAGSRFGGFVGQAEQFLNAIGVVIVGPPEAG